MEIYEDGLLKRGQPCLICGSVTLSTHFGVVSCRACAAFFRRTVSEGKDFVCRGGNSCHFYKNIRHACKKCRLERCCRFGMKKEGIVSKYKIGTTEKREVNQENLPTSSSSLTPKFSYSKKPSIIKKLVENYRTLCSVRKATELALFPLRSPTEVVGIEGLSFGTSKVMSLFFRAHIPTVINFISSSFVQEFALLAADDRWQLLQPFLVYFWWFDSSYRTYKKVHRSLHSRINAMSETMYCDVERVDEWMSDMIVSPPVVETNVREFIMQKYLPENQQLQYYFDSMALSEEEYVSAVGLLFWNFAAVEHCQVTENCKKIVEQVRKSIYEELNEIYSRSLPSWQIRYGELLNLVNHIVIDCLRAKEELGLLYSLDAFKKEDFFYEMNISQRQAAVNSTTLQ